MAKEGRGRGGKQLDQEKRSFLENSSIFCRHLPSVFFSFFIFFSHTSIPQTSFEKQTKGSWHQTINNADTQIGVKCFGFHNTYVCLNGRSCTHTSYIVRLFLFPYKQYLFPSEQSG